MSLYESFLLLNMFRMLLQSSSGAGDCMWVYCSVSVCTGVLVRFGWSRVVSECRLVHYCAQHVSNVITFILRSRWLYVGVLFCFGVYWCIGAVRLEQGGIRVQVGALILWVVLQPAFGYHPIPAEQHQYTSTHRNRATHTHMVVIFWGWL